MEGEGQRGSCDNHHHLIMSEDVLIQTLLCLPVKSLLRFKSVCKSWHTIIQSTFFINLHATTTKLGGSTISVLFNRSEEHKEKKGDNLYTVSGKEFEVFEDLGRPPLVDLGGDPFVEVVFKNIRFGVLDCCNGIICLHDSFAKYIILWNPAIKQSRVVPKPSNLLGNLNWVDDDHGYYYHIVEDVVAFGVDIKTNDYKVLLITTLQPYPGYYGTDSDSDGDDDDDDDDDDDEERLMRNHRRVHVYSSSTDSWRCIDDTLSAAHPNLRIDRYANGGRLYLNGSHFFTASCRIKVDECLCTMPLIMSFDFTEEIFRTIQPPFDWIKNKNTNTSAVYFIPFDEKIALVDAKANSLHRFECDIWVLLNEQHNGVKESWTKLYTFGHSCRFYPSATALRCIANNGEFAIVYCSCPGGERIVWKLQLLNLITGETKCLRQSGRQGCEVDLKVNIYKPSLVQIGRSGATTNEKCT